MKEIQAVLSLLTAVDAPVSEDDLSNVLSVLRTLDADLERIDLRVSNVEEVLKVITTYRGFEG